MFVYRLRFQLMVDLDTNDGPPTPVSPGFPVGGFGGTPGASQNSQMAHSTTDNTARWLRLARLDSHVVLLLHSYHR